MADLTLRRTPNVQTSTRASFLIQFPLKLVENLALPAFQRLRHDGNVVFFSFPHGHIFLVTETLSMKIWVWERMAGTQARSHGGYGGLSLPKIKIGPSKFYRQLF